MSVALKKLIEAMNESYDTTTPEGKSADYIMSGVSLESRPARPPSSRRDWMPATNRIKAILQAYRTIRISLPRDNPLPQRARKRANNAR